MKLLFLDIDGVLNDHRPQQNGYCGMQPDKVARLNRILAECPDLLIVLSSAWRYCVHNGWTTLDGLEHLMLTHGIDCRKRLHGVTDPDAATYRESDHEGPFDQAQWSERGLIWRKQQIENYVQRTNQSARTTGSPYCEAFVVLDDLALDMPELIQTIRLVAPETPSPLGGEGQGEGAQPKPSQVLSISQFQVGLTDAHATEAIRRLA